MIGRFGCPPPAIPPIHRPNPIGKYRSFGRVFNLTFGSEMLLPYGISRIAFVPPPRPPSRQPIVGRITSHFVPRTVRLLRIKQTPPVESSIPSVSDPGGIH